jgi:hypothetical protein
MGRPGIRLRPTAVDRIDRCAPANRPHGRTDTRPAVPSDVRLDPVSPDHVASRPCWTCRACGRPWPCDPKREELAVEFGQSPLSLSFYLAAQYVSAVDDFTAFSGPIPPHLYERFLAWAPAALRQQGKRECQAS